MPPLMAPAQSRRLVHALLVWFRCRARDLPWRRTLGPYAIWVSEIMLQQTQVATVIPYWQRWMSAFPDVRRLAQAPLEQVLKLWEGLGYYSRARNLHRAAGLICEAHHGSFPRDEQSILGLPGIGRYTAGAIRSIAFNLPAPILDGNVARVLCRIMAMGENMTGRTGRQWLWAQAAQLVQGASLAARSHAPGLSGNCSALNQALMELGALVCRPLSPSCPDCPLGPVCRARKLGAADRFPVQPGPVRATAVTSHAFVLERAGRIWIGRRGAGRVNAGLWEFPNFTEGVNHMEPAEGSEEILAAFRMLPSRQLLSFRHSITRYRISMHAHHVRLAAQDPLIGNRFVGNWRSRIMQSRGWEGSRWVSAEDALTLPFSSAHLRILRAWSGGKHRPRRA